MIATQSMSELFSRDPWPHQLQGVTETISKFGSGVKSVCLTSPTGSGKSIMMVALTNWATREEKRVLLFTNRILLTEQTHGVFEAAGVSSGVISSTMKHLEHEHRDVQIATMQTVLARRRADSSYWVDADLVLVDEVHQVASGESAALLNEYRDRGSKVAGITATPLGVSNVCDELVVAARTRDLQQQGVLCFAQWFAPSELDTRKLVKGKVDLSLTENDARKTWGPLRGEDKQRQVRTRIVGNILQHYERLHPQRSHTLAFAPGVKESLWAAQFCHSRGIRALHIDGTDFWCDGEMYDRKFHDAEFRNFMQAWRDGSIPIIWNRFVMREGIDEPQIKCLLLATPIGSYRSFLQMVGRGLRTHEDKQYCRVLDFGGCLDEQSEVLTKRGWLGIDEITDDDTIGTMNLDSSAFEWCQNEGTIRKPRDAEMVTTKAGSPHLDFRVTGYHEMVMTPDTRHCKWRKQFAGELAGRKSVCQIPVSLVEDVAPCELTDSELTFIGWFFTDGCKEPSRIRIYQSTNAPVEHHDSITGCLKGCGFKWRPRYRTRPNPFTVDGRECSHVEYDVSMSTKYGGRWEVLTPWLDKTFPLDVFEQLDRRQFGVLLHAMNLGDGCKHKGYNQNTVTLAVSSREASDRIQSLAIRRGYRCNIAVQHQPAKDDLKESTIHLLHIRDTQHAHIMPGTLTSGYIVVDERVWCVQTRNGTLICRRNGKVCVMGNSWWRHGSPNVNADWESVYECQDPDVLSKNRIAEFRETGDSAGIGCPNCGMIHKPQKGRLLYCHHCNHKMVIGKPSRPIMQADGTLTEVSGEPIKQWKIRQTPEAIDIWKGLYWNAVKKNQDVTFNALYQRFHYKTSIEAGSRERPAFWKGYYPERDLPLMPNTPNGWHRKVADLHVHELY